MAVLVFVATMALLYGGAIILSLGAAVGGAVIGGGRAIELIDRFMTENIASPRLKQLRTKKCAFMAHFFITYSIV